VTTAIFDRAIIGLAILLATASAGHADPTLAYATYLGGSDDDAGDDALVAVAVDPAGNVYLAGNTRSVDFPGGQGVYYGGVDVFVTKLSPSGALICRLRPPAPAAATTATRAPRIRA
jgi:hypothetical protein